MSVERGEIYDESKFCTSVDVDTSKQREKLLLTFTCPTWTPTMSLNSSLRGAEAKPTSYSGVAELTARVRDPTPTRYRALQPDRIHLGDWLHYRYARLSSRRCCYSNRGETLCPVLSSTKTTPQRPASARNTLPSFLPSFLSSFFLLLPPPIFISFFLPFANFSKRFEQFFFPSLFLFKLECINSQVRMKI